MNCHEALRSFIRPIAFIAILCAGDGAFTTALPARADKLPTAAAAAVPGTIEDTDEDWTWTGMQAVPEPQCRNGSIRAGGLATSGVYLFTGTGVGIYGPHASTITIDGKPHDLGKMVVRIDGAQKAVIDLSKPPADPNARIFQIDDLKKGNHVLQLKVTEGWGAVDYIAIQDEPAASKSVAGDDGQDYRLSPKHAPDKWLDVKGDTMEDEAGLSIFAANRPGHSQIWHVVSVGNGIYRLSPKEDPEQALTVLLRTVKTTVSANTLAGLYKYNADLAQQWEFIPSGGGYYRIANLFDHRFLNVDGGLTANGSPVIIYQLTAGNNDQWRFVPVP